MSKKIDTHVDPLPRPHPLLGVGAAPMSHMPRVLMALPSDTEARALETALERVQITGRSADLGAAPSWPELLSTGVWDGVLADAELDSAGLLSSVEGLPDAPAIVLLAGFGTATGALEAIRRGAFDSLARPVSPDEVAMAVTKALEARELRRENHDLRVRLGERFALGHLISRDPEIAKIAKIVDSVADTRANVLITGESGTGKTLLARAVHQHSARRDQPFVEVNCGALPTNLLESELFGHVRGAFTGAVRDKLGLFDAADGGTIFLDEIGTASMDLQVKLLRVLQDRTFERVGDAHTRTVDVRLVAATNSDLAMEVAEGRFREDLFWRLNVITFDLPPLRERPGDVALLAEAFTQRFAEDYDRPIDGLEHDCLARLCAFDWPGNVRQLENAIERAVLLGDGPRLRASDLPSEVVARLQGPAQAERSMEPAAPMDQEVWGPDTPFPTLKEALAGPERRIIVRALEQTGGQRQGAATLLGINRTTLFNKMRKYGLFEDPPSVSCESPPGSS